MQTLELEDKVASQLKQIATQAHISTNELIEQLLSKYITEEAEPTTLNDFVGLLKDSSTFKGDPVDIQRKMRDEWN